MTDHLGRELDIRFEFSAVFADGFIMRLVPCCVFCEREVEREREREKKRERKILPCTCTCTYIHVYAILQGQPYQEI